MAYWIVIFLGILILIGSSVNAQVSYDSAVTQECTFCVSMSTTHTGNSAADRRAMSGVAIYDSGAEGYVTTSITYGGETLSFVDRQVSGDGTVKSELFTRPAYLTGLRTIEWNFDNPVRVVGGLATVSNLHATTPLGTIAKATGVSTTPSVSCTSTAGDLVIDVLATQEAPTVDGSQTQNWNATHGDGTLRGASSRETASGTSTVMSWSQGSETWSTVCVALMPPAAPAGTRRIWRVLP